MNQIAYLPPEVCGCLSLAQNHIDAARRIGGRQCSIWRKKQRARKHEQKVQKLVNKAARLLNGELQLEAVT